MKEIWFENQYTSMILNESIKKTFRELPEEIKNNDYRVGEQVWLRIHDGKRNFSLEQGIIDILKIETKKIDSLETKDFLHSDISCKEELKEKFCKFYKKNYTGNELIRLIEFDYASFVKCSVIYYAYSIPFA